MKDGGGIAPDVEVGSGTLSQVSTELYLRNYIFDYATSYYWKHQDIKTPEQLKFSDTDYEDFKNYLIGRKFNYRTFTEQSYSDLVSNAKKEKYYTSHKDVFDALEKNITHDLEQDLKEFKPEITELLMDEIIGRYFYEEGAIKWTIKTDEQIQKAVDVLNNKEMYTSILNGKSGAIQASRSTIKETLTYVAAKKTGLKPI